MTDISAGPATRVTWWAAWRHAGYFYRQAAMITIGMGVFIHLVRVFFGDDLTLQYVMTPTFDKVLTVPMTYAAIAGICAYRRMVFVNKQHRVAGTVSLAYIALSIPFHIYFSYVRGDLGPYLRFFPMWFSYLLFFVYAAFIVVFARIRFKEES